MDSSEKPGRNDRPRRRYDISDGGVDARPDGAELGKLYPSDNIPSEPFGYPPGFFGDDDKKSKEFKPPVRLPYSPKDIGLALAGGNMDEAMRMMGANRIALRNAANE